ncbi:hypothetical protein Q3G72_032235 [Acer saccharum]|nr:hypothetical protein Q3G72_032235 [Acer saccharum]
MFYRVANSVCPMASKLALSCFLVISCGIPKAPLQIVGMKFLDWYLKIAIGSALVGGSMEFFMIKTGFYDKVTVLESEKRAWETSPEALAVKEALNPWRKHDEEAGKSS